MGSYQEQLGVLWSILLSKFCFQQWEQKSKCGLLIKADQGLLQEVPGLQDERVFYFTQGSPWEKVPIVTQTWLLIASATRSFITHLAERETCRAERNFKMILEIPMLSVHMKAKDKAFDLYCQEVDRIEKKPCLPAFSWLYTSCVQKVKAPLCWFWCCTLKTSLANKNKYVYSWCGHAK